MAARLNKKAGGTPTTPSTGTPAPAKAKPSPATPKSSSSPPAKSAAASGSRPKVWPDGINEPLEPADKWRWTAARFIKKHWDKHGCATSQQALREHLESKKMEDYHANLFHLLEVAAEETPSGIPESIRVLALASNEADSGIPANELHLVMASLMEGAGEGHNAAWYAGKIIAGWSRRESIRLHDNFIFWTINPLSSVSELPTR